MGVKVDDQVAALPRRQEEEKTALTRTGLLMEGIK
jgi:hypothetical protein